MDDPEKEVSKSTSIDTGGGASVGHDVNAGRDFAGRDIVKQFTTYIEGGIVITILAILAIVVIAYIAISYAYASKKTNIPVSPTDSGTNGQLTKGLRLVDVSVIDDGPPLVLDLKLRNAGKEISVVKKVKIYVMDFHSFDVGGCFAMHHEGSLSFSAEYNFDIRDIEKGKIGEFSLSQQIAPDTADRIKFILQPKFEQQKWILYKIAVELVYDEDDKSLVSDPILFVSSLRAGITGTAESLYGYGVPYFVKLFIKCYYNNSYVATTFFSDAHAIYSYKAQLECREWQKAKNGEFGAGDPDKCIGLGQQPLTPTPVVTNTATPVVNSP